ncbi:MAG: hypothetical protein OXK76_05325 [Gammaproteobacteria bacterium]|nr:hypothetical protein [Gammaproteobacteria bacterium]
MTATVIDTLRYADRLKQAGVEPGQAEGMSRALNDELTEGLVTRRDLNDAVTGLKGDLNDAVTGLKGDLNDAVTGLKGDLNDAVTGLKGDLNDAVTGLKGDLNDAVTELRGDIDGLGNRIDVLETKFDAKFDGVDGKFDGVDAKFDAVDARFEAMDAKFDAKFDALRSQNKYVFLVLALIAGLGLYNATAPHFLGKNVQADRSSLAVPTAQTTADPTSAATTPGS